MKKHSQSGFTIVEIVVVIVVLGILAGLTYAFAVPNYRQRTYYTRSISEMNTMGNGMNLYLAKYNDYPPDVSRDIPSALKEFMKGQYVESWPDAPYPGSVYDYDNWPPDANGPLHTYQISLRMCNVGDNATCKANAIKYLSDYVDADVLEDWDAQSSMYYCIKGSCRSHQSQPMDHPGYCINCGEAGKVF